MQCLKNLKNEYMNEIVMGTYNNLKDLVVDYANGFGIECSELKRRIQKAYDDEIRGHEYDDLMQYMED